MVVTDSLDKSLTLDKIKNEQKMYTTFYSRPSLFSVGKYHGKWNNEGAMFDCRMLFLAYFFDKFYF